MLLASWYSNDMARLARTTVKQPIYSVFPLSCAGDEVRGDSVAKVGNGVGMVVGVVLDVGGTVEEVRDGAGEVGDCVSRVGDS